MSEGSELAARSCVPCQGAVPPLPRDEVEALLLQLDGWELVDDHHIRRDFRFDTYRHALEFVKRAAAISEEEGHHPEMTLGFGHVKVEIWTHKIDGLTESDFVLAAKLDGTGVLDRAAD